MIKRSETNGRQQNKGSFYRRVLAILIVLTVSLSLARVVSSNLLAVSGQRLSAANQKIEELVEENEKIENEISTLKSLARVEEEAKKRGFVKTSNVQTLSSSGPVANR